MVVTLPIEGGVRRMSRFSSNAAVRAIAVLSAASALTACAAGTDLEGAGGAAVSAGPKVSGYDLAGPQRLSADKVGPESCDAVTAERIACERADGLVVRANGCKDLCS